MNRGSEKRLTNETFINFRERCEAQMDLSVCSGCDACGLRCAQGVPSTAAEWGALREFLSTRTDDERAAIARVERQDKALDLGDGVQVRMCRYRDMEAGGCAVYPARPLVCRLLGHVEWMPCPIEKVLHPIATPDALALMSLYAGFRRRTFEEWETEASPSPAETANDK